MHTSNSVHNFKGFIKAASYNQPPGYTHLTLIVYLDYLSIVKKQASETSKDYTTAPREILKRPTL